MMNSNATTNAEEKPHKQHISVAELWYETPLPKPPVPKLEDTMRKYLEYVSVIADGQPNSHCSFEKTKAHVREFINGNGQILQRRLERIGREHTNWVNRFWLPEMYLGVRLALPVNSNPAYIFPQQSFTSTDQQIHYTACLIRGICTYKDRIDRKTLPRDVSTGRLKVNMCMEQYGKMFSSYRQATIDCDRQITNKLGNSDGNEHVLVMCNNQAFIVRIKCNHVDLSRREIEHQLRDVVRMSTNRCKTSVVPIAAATAGNRNDGGMFWASVTQLIDNEKSLKWIQTASFAVCLDMVKTPINGTHEEKEETMAMRSHHLLHGLSSQMCGLNRWYDMPIQVIVASDGTNGMCIEHSVAEGIVIINMAECALKYVEDHLHAKELATTADQVNTHQFKPKPLSWHISSDEQQLLQRMKQHFDSLATDLEMKILVFDDYGKEFPKQRKVSPDGFVQLALQLAYYKAHGHLVSTYESASIRRFQSGRVDNIRAATPEALKFVQTMENPQATDEIRRKAFEVAANKQAQVILENITGYGIDNHLCGLQVLDRESVVEGEQKALSTIFTDPLYGEAIRFPLSTSQVTTSFADSFLCYGPVQRDGYGCAYDLMAGEITFAISAFKSHPKTSAVKYREHLKHSLLALKNLLQQ